MRKSTGITEEPLPTTHNVEGWRSCTCRSEIENRVVSGNASENMAGRRVDVEYLKDNSYGEQMEIIGDINHGDILEK